MPGKGQVGSEQLGIRMLHAGVVMAGLLMSIITMGLTETLAFLLLSLVPILAVVRRPLLAVFLGLTLVATACASSAPPSAAPATMMSVPPPPPPPRPVLEQVAPDSRPEIIPVGGCEPSYPDVCLATSPPDLNCAQVAHKDIRVLAPDPHSLDGGDNDGLGCET